MTTPFIEVGFHINEEAQNKPQTHLPYYIYILSLSYLNCADFKLQALAKDLIITDMK